MYKLNKFVHTNQNYLPMRSVATTEQNVRKIIVSKPMTVVTVVVLKKYYPQLDAYLREKFEEMPDVNLTPLAAGRHNVRGYNRIEVALKESGLDGPPQAYQGYQLRYPLVINSKVGHVLSEFSVK